MEYLGVHSILGIELCHGDVMYYMRKSCDWFNDMQLPDSCRRLMVKKVGVQFKLHRLTLNFRRDLKERVAQDGASQNHIRCSPNLHLTGTNEHVVSRYRDIAFNAAK